tara:strand:+ start:3373 stop:3729 length:357 start_codon:yes stop_codon:yes gene_type:complete
MPFFTTRGAGASIDEDTLTIASGATTSSSLDLRAKGLVGFLMPATFTGTTMTFTGSMDDSTFTALYNADNTAFSITVAVARRYCLNPADFLGVRYVRFVSGSSEGGARTIEAVTRSLS